MAIKLAIIERVTDSGISVLTIHDEFAELTGSELDEFVAGELAKSDLNTGGNVRDLGDEATIRAKLPWSGDPTARDPARRSKMRWRGGKIEEVP